MIVTFWGTRGTIPVPGAATVRYGGDTSCVTVEIDGAVLVIDTGTGVRALGQYLLERDVDVYIVLTHLHADHVMGFPYFAPLWQPDRRIHVLDYEHPARPGPWSPLQLLDGVHFPVLPEGVPSAPVRVSDPGPRWLEERGFPIRRLALNHPGGAWAYRIEAGGRAFVHVADNELAPPGDAVCSLDSLTEFAADADLLAHDSQFLTHEIARRRGWGHSTVEESCALAEAAGVGRLLLFHHDPGRSDDALADIEADASLRLVGAGVGCQAAYDGLRLEL